VPVQTSVSSGGHGRTAPSENDEPGWFTCALPSAVSNMIVEKDPEILWIGFAKTSDQIPTRLPDYRPYAGRAEPVRLGH